MITKTMPAQGGSDDVNVVSLADVRKARGEAPPSAKVTPEKAAKKRRKRSLTPRSKGATALRTSSALDNVVSGMATRLKYKGKTSPSCANVRDLLPANPTDVRNAVAPTEGPAFDPVPEEHLSQSRRKLEGLYAVEFNAWRGMRDRERKGICTIHLDLKEFRGFLTVVGRAPGAGWTIDKINPHDVEYAPGKVRWADKKTQANNRTNNRLVTIDGKDHTLSQAAELLGMNADALRKRLDRGTPIELIAEERLGRAVTVEPSPWPEGGNVTLWGNSFKGWHNGPMRKHPAATKDVFVAWLCHHRLRGPNGLTARRDHLFPGHFGPEAYDEADGLPEHIETHPVYAGWLAHHEARQEAEERLRLCPDQWALYMVLRRYRYCSEPKDAASKRFQRFDVAKAIRHEQRTAELHRQRGQELSRPRPRELPV